MNSMLDRPILVIGTGSIGKRHAFNLREMGFRRIILWDPDRERRVRLADEIGATQVQSLQDGLSNEPNLVFICSPPRFHVDQALASVRAGANVFIEKPLSDSFVGVGELIQETSLKKATVQVGYNLRFLPVLRRIKQLIDGGALGSILWARAEFGYYLPEWRPADDYRRSYTARKELGGGILLDASHEVDYMLWLLGRPNFIRAVSGKVSNLQIDVEDCATILLRFPSGTLADIHIDFVQRAYSRGCKIVGERGSVEWVFDRPLRHYRAESKAWEEVNFSWNPAQTYVDEIADFLDCIQSGRPPLSNLESASLTLDVVLRARGDNA